MYELRTVDRGGGGPREVERLVGGRVAGIFQTEVGETGQTVLIAPYVAAASGEAGERREGRFGPPELPGRIELLTPAPYMNAWEACELGQVWELSWFDFAGGAAREALVDFETAVNQRSEIYPVVGCLIVDTGPWRERIYVLTPYKDWDHRDEVTHSLRDGAIWPPRTRTPAIGSGNKVLLPAGSSALR